MNAKDRALLLMLTVTGALACDPSNSVSRLGVFAFARNGLLTECCNCLATTEVYVTSPLYLCPEVDVDVVDGGWGDDRCADDAGPCVLEKTTTPCLCTFNANQCRDRLSRDIAVQVVGTCIEPAGPCEAACSGTLAYTD
jgi:hypothetical protein